MLRAQGILLASILLLLQGCATSPGGTRTAMDRAITKCVLSIGIGAIAGAVIGHNVGSGNAGAGAAIGAAAGGVACAVFVKLAKEDRERIRALEERAVSENESQVQTFITQSGSTATLNTRVSEAPIPESAPDQPAFTNCRYSNQTLEVQGQSAVIEPQLWCRLETGNWTPVSP